MHSARFGGTNSGQVPLSKGRRPSRISVRPLRRPDDRPGAEDEQRAKVRGTSYADVQQDVLLGASSSHAANCRPSGVEPRVKSPDENWPIAQPCHDLLGPPRTSAKSQKNQPNWLVEAARGYQGGRRAGVGRILALAGQGFERPQRPDL